MRKLVNEKRIELIAIKIQKITLHNLKTRRKDRDRRLKHPDTRSTPPLIIVTFFSPFRLKANKKEVRKIRVCGITKAYEITRLRGSSVPNDAIVTLVLSYQQGNERAAQFPGSPRIDFFGVAR